MPDMLVLRRDAKTGGLKMFMEIDQDPRPEWCPGPMPVPGWHVDRDDGDCGYENYRDVQQLKDAILDYVYHEQDDHFAAVNWTSLDVELDRYLLAAR